MNKSKAEIKVSREILNLLMGDTDALDQGTLDALNSFEAHSGVVQTAVFLSDYGFGVCDVTGLYANLVSVEATLNLDGLEG